MCVPPLAIFGGSVCKRNRGPCSFSVVPPLAMLSLSVVFAFMPLPQRTLGLAAMAAPASPGHDGSDADIPSEDDIRGRSISPEWAGQLQGAEVVALPTTKDDVTGHVGFMLRVEFWSRSKARVRQRIFWCSWTSHAWVGSWVHSSVHGHAMGLLVPSLAHSC